MKVFKTILEYLFVFLIVMQFNTLYTQFIHDTYFFGAIVLVLLLLLVVNVPIKFSPIVGFLFMGGLVPLLNVHSSLKVYVLLYLTLLPLMTIYIMTYYKSNKGFVLNLLYKFSNIIFILALLSLVFWIFGSNMETIPYTGLVPTQWGGDDRFIPTYYGLYFETQEYTLFSESYIRNSGVFCEAPMFNFVLCTALAIDLFLRPVKKVIRPLIFVVTIISTMSATGIILIILMLTFILLEKQGKQKNFIGLTIIGLVLAVMFLSISSVMDSKKETGSNSYNNRSEDIVRCMEVGMEHPFLGIGILYPANEFGGQANMFGFSNSTFTSFAHGGFYFLFLFIVSLLIVPFSIVKKTKRKRLIPFILCYFILFTFTVTLYTSLNIFFISFWISTWESLFISLPSKEKIILSNSYG